MSYHVYIHDDRILGVIQETFHAGPADANSQCRECSQKKGSENKDLEQVSISIIESCVHFGRKIYVIIKPYNHRANGVGPDVLDDGQMPCDYTTRPGSRYQNCHTRLHG